MQITDSGESPNGSVFFAMDLLEARDLHAILRAHAPLRSPAPAGCTCSPKPQMPSRPRTAAASSTRRQAPNIFVLEGPGLNAFVKLLDFGIAKILAPTAAVDSALVKNLTGTGVVFGTAKCMAPEQT